MKESTTQRLASVFLGVHAWFFLASAFAYSIIQDQERWFSRMVLCAICVGLWAINKSVRQLGEKNENV